MYPDEWKGLQVGDRLRDNEAFRGDLWKVTAIHSDGVTLWSSSRNRNRFVLWAQLSEMTTVWEEGERAPTPRSLWERILED